MRVCPECGRKTEVETCPFDGTATIDEGLFQDKADPLLGRLLVGRYRVLELLGSGGMGRVYIAEQTAVRRHVALKVIMADQAADPSSRFELVRRFQREAQAASRLEHPNTVRVFDFGHTDDGVLFLAMELLKGTTLSGLLRSQPVFPARRVIRIASQVCKSMSEAHSAGIVHRDLKPDNIMIIPMAGEPDFVKVLDFGIAKIVSHDTGNSSITRTGMVMGTPSYMAPEQATGTPVTAATDLYSLGVILYECLSGRPPFTGDTPLSVLMKHVNEPIPPIPIRQFPPEVPQDLVDLVMRLLEKSPRVRPASALDVLLRLEQIDLSNVPDVRPTAAPAVPGTEPQFALARPGTLIDQDSAPVPVVKAEPLQPTSILVPEDAPRDAGSKDDIGAPTVALDRPPGFLTPHSGVGTMLAIEAPASRRKMRWLWLPMVILILVAVAVVWAFLAPGQDTAIAEGPTGNLIEPISAEVPEPQPPPIPEPEPVPEPQQPPQPVIAPASAEAGVDPEPVAAPAASPAIAEVVAAPKAVPAPRAPRATRARPSRVSEPKPAVAPEPSLPQCSRLKCPFSKDCLNAQGKRTSGKDYCILDF